MHHREHGLVYMGKKCSVTKTAFSSPIGENLTARNCLIFPFHALRSHFSLWRKITSVKRNNSATKTQQLISVARFFSQQNATTNATPWGWLW